jgi:hypothetical protein
MSVAAPYRRSSWIPLLPRHEVAQQTGSMAAVLRDLAARELLRNEPAIFITGVLAGEKPQFHWKDTFLPIEVEIVEQCADYTSFEHFVSLMILMFPSDKSEKVRYRSIRLWDQIMSNRGE